MRMLLFLVYITLNGASLSGLGLLVGQKNDLKTFSLWETVKTEIPNFYVRCVPTAEMNHPLLFFPYSSIRQKLNISTTIYPLLLSNSWDFCACLLTGFNMLSVATQRCNSWLIRGSIFTISIFSNLLSSSKLSTQPGNSRSPSWSTSTPWLGITGLHNELFILKITDGLMDNEIEVSCSPG